MRTTRSLGAVVLLALALVLVAVLAYQAQDAARSHQRTAERTLSDYASFAGWQLSQQAKNSILGSIILSLSVPASRVNPAKLDQTLMSPEAVEDVARSMVEPWCHCFQGVRYFFRYDWHDGTFRTTATQVPDEALAWARDTIVAYARSLPPVAGRQPTIFGSPDASYGPLKQLAALLTNDSYAMIFREPAKSRKDSAAVAAEVVVFVVTRDPRDARPVAIYGYETDPRTFLAPTLGLIHRQSALLPPSLLRDTPPDSILYVNVSTLDGREVYRSSGSWPRYVSAADTVEKSFGQLVMQVGIRPEMASRLIVGGLPRSRLPVLLGVFILTAGLLVAALVQLRRQQELARLRTEFVSGVSHELRTPLAQIRWFAELLRIGKLRSDEERSRSAGIIDQEARRLTYLVENVLNFSRSEKGTNRVSPAPLDLESEIRDALEMFAPLARSRKVSLRAELELGLTVLADRDALRQMLLNMLDNAVKYGPAGQTITVGSAGAITAGASPRARLWVEDQGPGIAVGDRERVWDPYIRLNRSPESATGGSGIGLAVVRELVTMQGGRAWVEAAESGGGARFVLELPLAVADASREPVATNPPKSLSMIS